MTSDPYLVWPHLVWRGRDEELPPGSAPLHVQERADPAALVALLGPGTETTAWKHGDGWVNRFVLGDSAIVMNSLIERERLQGAVQTVFMDPPYGIGFSSNWQKDTATPATGDGHLSAEPEVLKAFRDTWRDGVHSYLSYLRARLLAARLLLSERGSIFVQIGDDNLHLVRCLMDEMFGAENFIATIPFRKKTMPLGAHFIEQMSDFLLWYTKSRPDALWHRLYRKGEGRGDPNFKYCQLPDGTRRPLTPEERLRGLDPALGARLYRLKSLEPSGPMPAGMFDYEFGGRIYTHPRNGYATDRGGMDNLVRAGRIEPQGNLLNYVLFLDDKPAADLTAPWFDTAGADDKIYVVQTNTEVVKRCILMTSEPGDLVLDPTCGGGTTAFVAEQWGRRWIAIDTSRVALTLARQRLLTARLPAYRVEGGGGDPSAGFIYEQAAHVTLTSIARGKPAESVILHDRPLVEKSRVRLSGPFTMESLSPGFALAGIRGEEDDGFVPAILESLKRSGVQNGRKQERLAFTALRPWPGGLHIHAEGSCKAGRAGIVIGPEYGSVTAGLLDRALAEAAGIFDLLILCGFSFEPGIDTEGAAIPVLKVRMNADLHMSPHLSDTGAGNLFTVFGEPDLALTRRDDGDFEIAIRGIDVFDPATGAIRSGGVDAIACWFIDTDYGGTDYGGECFILRHAYFPGGRDPWEKLARTLKGEIDAQAWASLRRTVSRPFPRPASGRIAVKIINHYGDEVMKIYDLPPDGAEGGAV